jgi:hypothetical protein
MVAPLRGLEPAPVPSVPTISGINRCRLLIVEMQKMHAAPTLEKKWSYEKHQEEVPKVLAGSL